MIKNKLYNIAPVAIFAYNRPDHFSKTINSLSKCLGFGSGPITVYIDGPKNSDDKTKISRVKSLAHRCFGGLAEIKCRPSNMGLAQSITKGVKEQLDRYGTVIVIEDELTLDKKFLIFMSMALNRYANEDRVFQISGYSYISSNLLDSNNAFFLPLTTTWGWATWSRAWKSYDHKAVNWHLLEEDYDLRNNFNLGGAYDYATMLEKQMNKNIDSWGIRWYWSVFKKNGIVLFPPNSLVINNGMDGTGSHGSGLLTNFRGTIKSENFMTPNLPDAINVNQSEFSIVKKAIWKQNGGYLRWIIDRVKIFAKFIKHLFTRN